MSMSSGEAIDHLIWTFEHSPKTAKMFEEAMKKLIEKFEASLKEAERVK